MTKKGGKYFDVQKLQKRAIVNKTSYKTVSTSELLILGEKNKLRQKMGKSITTAWTEKERSVRSCKAIHHSWSLIVLLRMRLKNLGPDIRK